LFLADLAADSRRGFKWNADWTDWTDLNWSFFVSRRFLQRF